MRGRRRHKFDVTALIAPQLTGWRVAFLVLLVIVQAAAGCGGGGVSDGASAFEKLAGEIRNTGNASMLADLADHKAGLKNGGASADPKRQESDARYNVNPKRNNPFLRAESDTARKPNAPAAIELRGFVDVGGLAAILVVRGNPVLIRQGEIREGLKMVDIRPPEAVFEKNGVLMTVRLPKS